MRSPCVGLILLAVLCTLPPALADKLDDLGLDRSGRPEVKAQATAPAVVVAERDGELITIAVDEQDLPTELHQRISWLAEAVIYGISRPAVDDVGSPFPTGSELLEVHLDDGRLRLVVSLPTAFLDRPEAVEARGELMLRALQFTLQDARLSSFEMLVSDPHNGALVSLDHYLPERRPDHRGSEPERATPTTGSQPSKQFPRLGSGRPNGSLSGKDIYLNPGHGWTFRDSTTDYWGLQRGFVQANIEDFSNVDLINQWLAAYCYNAGADVFSVRESDPQTAMVIADNDDGAPAYVEGGTGWINSTLAGFANGHAPFVDGEDPFAFGSNRLAQCVVGAPTAAATWTGEIPADGWYSVSVSHAAWTNRAPQAHYEIRHAGGSTDFYVDQQQRRFTWIPVGTYFFDAGAPEDERQVVLYNDSSSASHYVSADAVRFGGGMGLIDRGTAGTSGKPRFDEDARYNLHFSGCPDYDGAGTDEADGWSRRPGFAGWLKYSAQLYGAPARDSVFISSHTNAYNGSATGLTTFVYTGYESTVHDRLRWFVHDEVINDLVNGYPGTLWDRGYNYGTYGENNPYNTTYYNSTPAMPIFLGEWLFHDSASDMAMYHDPVFRRLLARAIYQGIVKFWATENGSPSTLLPEPPQHFTGVQTGSTSAELGWQPPVVDGYGGDPATGYRLYRSTHGRGFPAGVDLGNVTTNTINDLVPGRTEYFYLTATNSGGESFPTEVLALRTTGGSADPRVLIVSAFDKLDISTRVQQPWDDGVLYRHLLRRMNTVDYVVEHASALAAGAPAVGLDACEDEVVGTGAIDLAQYDAVVWIGGIQSEVSTIDASDDTSITSGQQAALSTYLDGGGQLFVSGAEIAWDLDRGGGTSFVDTTLRASYVQDDAGVYTVSGSAGSIFAGLGPFGFDDGSGAAYAVNWPDVITPVGGAQAAMEYGSGAMVEDFDDLAGWWDPNSSGQTNADPASSFSVAVSPVVQGSGSADLYYVWGSGDFIREYNSALTPIPSDGLLSLWVHGDGSGHQLRLCIRDFTDNDLFVSDFETINFSGWQQLSWDLSADPVNQWYVNGNGEVDGTEVAFDSLQVERDPGGPAAGHLYFDNAVVSGGSASGMVAAVQYSGASKLVYLGFPFEAITDSSTRTQIMAAVAEFFDLEASGPELIFADGFEAGNTSAWSVTVP